LSLMRSPRDLQETLQDKITEDQTIDLSEIFVKLHLMDLL